MMFRKFITLFLFLHFLSFHLFSQQKYGKEMIPLAPDVWSFMKYGSGSQPDLYTGTLHEAIDLYSYHDRDFDFPVRLVYCTNGFMPNMTTGVLGLGWTLSAGGFITREVRQFRDEGSSSTLNGSIKFARQDYSANLLDSPRTFIDYPGTGMVYYQPVQGGLRYETEPDIFSFNFLGHSGKFIIVRTSDGSFQCLVFEADSSPGQYRIVPDDPGDGIISNFTMTTGNGYIYRFSHYENQDYSMSSTYEDDMPAISGDIHLTWVLTRVTSPTGRVMELDYSVSSGPYCVRPYASRVSSYQEYVTDGSIFLNGYESESLNSAVRSHMRFGSSAAYLRSINIPDSGVRITFHYSPRLHPEKLCRGGQTTEELPNTIKLDSISVDDLLRETKLKIIRMSYSYPSHGNPVLLLRRVYASGIGTWSMEYNREDGTFPYQGTTSIDHWGYFNDKSPKYNLADLIPEVTIGGTFLDQTINTVTSRREPDFVASTTGTLHRLYYPTGGFSEYAYEQNTYSHCLRRDANNYGFLYMHEESSDQPCGGLRIKSIRSGSSRREFSYDYEGRSSGILERYPYYYNYFSASLPDSSYRYMQMSMASFCTFAYPLDARNVVYSSVTETLANGGRTETKFSSFLDEGCADIYPDTAAIRVFGGINVASNLMNDAFVFPDSRHFLRGLILAVRHFASGSSVPWKEEHNTYREISVSDHDYFTSAHAAVSATYPHRLFLCTTLPDSTIYVIREGCDSMSIVRSFTYNSRGQIYEDRTVDYNMGRTDIVRYQYASDVQNGDNVFTTMDELGMGAQTVKELSAFHPSINPSESSFRLKSAKAYTYGVIDGVPMVCRVSGIRLSPNNPGPFAGFSFEEDMYTDLTVIYSGGRVVEEISRDGTHTIYLWGYDGLYPVAVLRNCSLSTYLSIAGPYGFGTCFENGLPVELKSLLYSDSRFETTVYDYVPNVGVTSITDPAGRTSYYTYDEYGRLTQVIDDRGHPVKAYRYHILSE